MSDVEGYGGVVGLTDVIDVFMRGGYCVGFAVAETVTGL
jgi:hypothetical protein